MADESTTTQDDGNKGAEASATPNLKETATKLVEKHGDSTAALMVLLGENYKHRDTIRELKGKLPAEGTLVLAADDAKAFQRYRALGDPKALETALTERDHYREKSDGFERERLHGEVAAAAGFKPSVLTRLATTDGLDLEVREIKDKLGKPVKTPVVVVKGDDDKETVTPLAEYADKHWQEFLPALKASAAVVKSAGTPQQRFEAPPRPRLSEQDGTPRLRRNVL